MREKSSSLKLIFFAVLFILIGVLTKKYYSDPIENKANASKDWPTVEGNIVESKVGSKRDDGNTMYFADINYNYIVDGVSYSNNKVRAIQYRSSSSKKAKSIVSKYPTGSTVQVHYNPDLPSVSLIEPGISGIVERIFLYMPILFIGIGGLILIQFFRA